MGNIIHKKKAHIHKRDNYTCSYCGDSFPEKKLVVDHIIPKYLGGKDIIENLTTACKKCNGFKSYYSVETFIERIKAKKKRALKNLCYYTKVIEKSGSANAL